MTTSRTPQKPRSWQIILALVSAMIIFAFTWLWMQPKTEPIQYGPIPPTLEFKNPAMDAIIETDKEAQRLRIEQLKKDIASEEKEISQLKKDIATQRKRLICTIIHVTDTIQMVGGYECRLYKTTTGDRWILSSEEWAEGDEIPMP